MAPPPDPSDAPGNPSAVDVAAFLLHEGIGAAWWVALRLAGGRGVRGSPTRVPLGRAALGLARLSRAVSGSLAAAGVGSCGHSDGCLAAPGFAVDESPTGAGSGPSLCWLHAARVAASRRDAGLYARVVSLGVSDAA